MSQPIDERRGTANLRRKDIGDEEDLGHGWGYAYADGSTEGMPTVTVCRCESSRRI